MSETTATFYVSGKNLEDLERAAVTGLTSLLQGHPRDQEWTFYLDVQPLVKTVGQNAPTWWEATVHANVITNQRNTTTIGAKDGPQ